jgi:hypothetical protein
MGRYIPEHQEIAPALREDAAADAIVVNDVQVTPYSSDEVLRTAGRFLGVSTAGSRCPCKANFDGEKVAQGATHPIRKVVHAIKEQVQSSKSYTLTRLAVKQLELKGSV